MAEITTSAIILAGGDSSRFGRDKASELLLGVPLLQRVLYRVVEVVDQIIIVKRPGQELPPLKGTVKVVEDIFPGTGPVGALYSGLKAAPPGFACAVACDMPLLEPALLAAMIDLCDGRDAVVPLDDGLPQPLCAVYSTDCADTIATQIEAGRLKLAAVLDFLDTFYLWPADWQELDPGGISFFNLNTPQDVERAVDLLGG